MSSGPEAVNTASPAQQDLSVLYQIVTQPDQQVEIVTQTLKLIAQHGEQGLIKLTEIARLETVPPLARVTAVTLLLDQGGEDGLRLLLRDRELQDLDTLSSALFHPHGLGYTPALFDLSSRFHDLPPLSIGSQLEDELPADLDRDARLRFAVAARAVIYVEHDPASLVVHQGSSGDGTRASGHLRFPGGTIAAKDLPEGTPKKGRIHAAAKRCSKREATEETGLGEVNKPKLLTVLDHTGDRRGMSRKTWTELHGEPDGRIIEGDKGDRVVVTSSRTAVFSMSTAESPDDHVGPEGKLVTQIDTRRDEDIALLSKPFQPIARAWREYVGNNTPVEPLYQHPTSGLSL